MRNSTTFTAAASMCVVLSSSFSNAPKTNKTKLPNVLVIQTDEHSFRTLGCYRDLMRDNESYLWGSKYNVETPNIDRLAREGAICTSYYASSPVSTPSRASFQTGLYPSVAGSPINDMAMHTNLTTFADVLREAGYNTSFVGKWHLSAIHRSKDNKLVLKPGDHDFGYDDREYMFEGGHEKWYTVLGEDNIEVSNDTPADPDPNMYSTDFLVDKCIDALDRDKDKDAPFYMMVSIPDPHSPDTSREPYTSMYEGIDYQMPETMTDSMKAVRPLWAVGGKGERVEFEPENIVNYFAMVKHIDDQVGRILNFLDENNLTENTIVIFNSDHGDLLYEHSKQDKDYPYETSAKVPFIIRYPGKILEGKVINKTCVNVDFAPTLLGMLNLPQIEGVHGINDAKMFLNKKKVVDNDDRIIYITDSPFNTWTAAVDGEYKLVLSCMDIPWLFDLSKNPEETINFYSDPNYKEIAERLQASLVQQMKDFKDPALYLERPYCYSADDKVTYKFVYDGFSYEQILEAEAETLRKAVQDMREKCFSVINK